MPHPASAAKEGLALTRILRSVANVNASRPVLIDLAFVLVISAINIFDALIFPQAPGTTWWWTLLGSLPGTCVLLFRRRFPWPVFLVVLGVPITLDLLDLSYGAMNLALLLGVYTICVRGGLSQAVAAVGLAMLLPVTRYLSMPWGESVLMNVGAGVDLVMFAILGRAIRIGRQRAEQLEQTVTLLDQARDQLAADAQAVERARIAREFHDIVSHNLSVVALRAGVARALVDRDPAHARDTLRELEQASSAALGEMRTMLGALRGDDGGEVLDEAGDAENRQPMPGLERLDALVDSVAEAGVTWRIERRGTVRELGTGIELTAYRIVQEAVTNVLKHGGPGHARVLLNYETAALRLEVTNHIAGVDGVPEPERRRAREPIRDSVSTAGHGLIGLRERVGLLGGTLTAHPIPKGFHLAAVLPFPENSDPA